MQPRKVTCTTMITGVDDEWPGGSETKIQNSTSSVVLSDDQPQNLLTTQMKWGGECRIEVTLTAQLLDNGRVRIKGNAKLFEGDSEDTPDLDDEENFEFVIPRGKTAQHSVHLLNEGSDDTGDVQIAATNMLVEEE